VRITFVYKYLTLGGVEVVLRSRLIALPALGIHPTLWFLSDGPGRGMFSGCDSDVRVGGLADFEGHLRSDDVDVVSVIDTPEALELAASLPQPPSIILEVHTPYPENRVYLRVPACEQAQMILVPSEHQRRVVLRELPFRSEVRVIPNPIGEGFEGPLEDIDSTGLPPIVAWVGRLDWLKNWREFLRMAAGVCRLAPTAEFWIAGSGSTDEEAAFVRELQRQELMPRVRWFRGLPYAAMPRFYDAVRASGGAVVSTSRGESFGMAIAEAMARGCVVVVPRQGPFPEFVTDGANGRLYQVGARSASARAVVEVLSNAEMRRQLGLVARQGILESHGTRAAASSLAEELTRLAARGSATGDPAGRTQAADAGEGSISEPQPRAESSSLGSPRQRPSLLNLDLSTRTEREALFAGYYKSGFWPGPGSSLEYTESIRVGIPRLLRKLRVRTILDAPCGDYEWFRKIDRDDVVYIGADIVAELVERNQRQFGDVRTRFVVLDVTCESLPKADLWLCRDCLFHFSDEDILITLENFLNSEIHYLLTTTYPRCVENEDIPTGSFRQLNLEIPPFNLPAPTERLDDWIEAHPFRQLALWDRVSIARALGR
jgi:glycosyltransferase involved in cell wall biosynthesis